MATVLLEGILERIVCFNEENNLHIYEQRLLSLLTFKE